MNKTVKCLLWLGMLAGIALMVTSPAMAYEWTMYGLFVAVGTQPRSELVKGQLELDSAGYVVAGEDTATSVPGVFVAGDLRRKPLKQVITAAADGAVAASRAIQFVLER